MRAELNQLPRRIFVDTNVLMNAAFVNGGVARHAMALLREWDFKLCLTEETRSEADNTLGRLRNELGLQLDPITIFAKFLQATNIRLFPGAPSSGFDAVQRRDQHIANACKEYSAWALTSDVRLISELRDVGLEAKLPWEVRMEALGGAAPPLPWIIRIGPIGKISGAIFARLRPGLWAGRRAHGEYTVCEIQNHGRLYYDNGHGEWIYKLRHGSQVALAFEMAQDSELTVAISYSPARDQAERTSFVLRAAQADVRDVSAETLGTPEFDEMTPGTTTFGHSIVQQAHWNGHLRMVVLSPKPISNWKYIVQTDNGAPDPYTEDVLKRALLALRIQPDGQFVPVSEHELFK